VHRGTPGVSCRPVGIQAFCAFPIVVPELRVPGCHKADLEQLCAQQCAAAYPSEKVHSSESWSAGLPPIRELAHPALQPAGESLGRRKMHPGSLYSFSLADPAKSKAVRVQRFVLFFIFESARCLLHSFLTDRLGHFGTFGSFLTESGGYGWPHQCLK